MRSPTHSKNVKSSSAHPSRSTASSSSSRKWRTRGRPTSSPKTSPSGDFKKAAEQLQKLQEKLQSGKMTEDEKKALKEQLGEMAKKLNELANLEQRKKQLEEARKNGGLSEQQFQREMDKLNEQTKSLKQLQQLAGKLGKAAEALQKGDTKKAAESLGMSQEQMAEMAKQLEEMESLDSAMADLQDAKNGMAPDGTNQLGDDIEQLRHGLQPAQGNGQRPGPRPGPGRSPRSPRRDRHLHQQGQATVEERQGGFPGLHDARQDRERGCRDRHPGRDRRRHRLGRRRPLQPEDPQEPREAHPVVLRPAQQGELIRAKRSRSIERVIASTRRRQISLPVTVRVDAGRWSGQRDSIARAEPRPEKTWESHFGLFSHFLVK